MPDQIELKKGGLTLPLFLREPACTVVKAEQAQDLLGQDIVKLTIQSVLPLPLEIGFEVTVFGKKYRMNQMPDATKNGERNFTYETILEGPQYTLRRAVFFNQDVSGFSTSGDFPLIGDAEFYLDVLINNLTRVFGGGSWIKGQFPTTAAKAISFNDTNCLSALQQICKEFDTEFDIVQGSNSHTLHIRKAGQVLGHTYEYGRGGGLYELKRQTVDNSDIINRLYPFGGNKNIPSNYRGYSPRLKLADPGYIDSPESIAAFDIIEGIQVWEDIYPHRTGSVTSVVSVNSFRDTSMDFDLFAKDGTDTKYILSGNEPKISFKSGNLAGFDFSLVAKTGYDHTTKTFTLLPYKDERGLQFPNPDEVAFQMSVGDEYVILDIIMPETYTEVAENELRFKAEQYLEQSKSPKVQYALQPYEPYLAGLAGAGSIVNVFEIGDYVKVIDTDFAIDKSSRIIGLRRDILKPYKYNLTLDDTYQTVTIVEIINKIRDTDKIIKYNDLRDPANARRGWLSTLELLAMVFDTDGYFDGGKIKPESIETLMLVVGAKSQQFILQDVIFQPNFEGDANVVEVSEGYLIHYALKEEIVSWKINSSSTTMQDNAARYIYAKLSKTDFQDGNIIFSTEQLLPDSDNNYYHFLVGTLHSVIDGVRWISLTYGATAINGRFIKTGRIQSFDGKTYFDLDLGAIGGYIKFLDSEGNYRDLSDIGAATDTFYAVTVTEDLDTYVNGKVTAWFQGTNPATWPGGEEAFHAGDHWYNTAANTVSKRSGGGWQPVSDPKVLKSYQKQFTRLNGDAEIQLFTAQPVAPYEDGDLWMSEDLGLRRSIETKFNGQNFDPNDWVEPFNYDNTATAIDGGIITSGLLQLAGDKSTVWAGVSGKGTQPESVRFWSGTSFLNANTAPWRILQNGKNYSRLLVAVEGMDSSDPDGYAVQAGLLGSEDEDASGYRIFAGGTEEEGRAGQTPFRVNGRGFAWMDRGQFGNIRIENGSISNYGKPEGDPAAAEQFLGEARLIFRNDPAGIFAAIGTNLQPGSAGEGKILGRIEVNAPTVGGDNIGMIFDASGATSVLGVGGRNISLYARNGMALMEGLNINGTTTKLINGGGPGSLTYIDPTLYEYVLYNVGASGSFITFIKEVYNNFPGRTGPPVEYALPLKDGCEVTVLANNDDYNYIMYRTLRPVNTSALSVNGGSSTTYKYAAGGWTIKSQFDNNY